MPQKPCPYCEREEEMTIRVYSVHDSKPYCVDCRAWIDKLSKYENAKPLTIKNTVDDVAEFNEPLVQTKSDTQTLFKVGV